VCLYVICTDLLQSVAPDFRGCSDTAVCVAVCLTPDVHSLADRSHSSTHLQNCWTPQSNLLSDPFLNELYVVSLHNSVVGLYKTVICLFSLCRHDLLHA
jgi:hypothetical protein